VAVIHVGNLIIQDDQWRRLNLIPKVADDFGGLYEPNPHRPRFLPEFILTLPKGSK
jgi:hypothetical protein